MYGSDSYLNMRKRQRIAQIASRTPIEWNKERVFEELSKPDILFWTVNRSTLDKIADEVIRLRDQLKK